nr:MAG TPA: Recombination enhancement function protein nuclease, DNase, HYDROLASE.4A [Bacteriophage sp.]
MQKSIIQADRKVCFLCERNGNGDPLECHHIFFGTPNRQHSDEDGLVVWLCGERCHRTGKNAAHRDAFVNRYLKREAQNVWELEKRKKGMTPEEARKAFISRYGKSEL